MIYTNTINIPLVCQILNITCIEYKLWARLYLELETTLVNVMILHITMFNTLTCFTVLLINYFR